MWDMRFMIRSFTVSRKATDDARLNPGPLIFKPRRKRKRTSKKIPAHGKRDFGSERSGGPATRAIMAQDEGRFGRIGDHPSCWTPKGMRPKAPRQIVRKFLCVYAAVRITLERMTSLILPFAKTDMVNLFLKEVAQDFKDFFVIMLIDQAGWHLSKRLEVPENIRLFPQPPIVPNSTLLGTCRSIFGRTPCQREPSNALVNFQTLFAHPCRSRKTHLSN